MHNTVSNLYLQKDSSQPEIGLEEHARVVIDVESVEGSIGHIGDVIGRQLIDIVDQHGWNAQCHHQNGDCGEN